MAAERVSIRQITADEIDVFRSIRLEALRCEPASFASRFEDWQFLPDWEWRQRLNDPIFVAFGKCEPIGMMGLVRLRPRKMAHRAMLVSVYVRKSERGAGVALALLNVVSDYARSLGILQLELAVNAENSPALRFYQRHEFIEIGRIPCGLLEGDREIADVMMVRRLNG
ncbi:GNAT family N-acetyltransferase (plasmid) [Rhizobium sp. B230/85]|uniref:GNAT family N-acetyltransferase n=1 Tax=unclassified Rhizobium TaxID=2613769 RepID=UPI001ADAB733|nr:MULTISPECIES: GNAT family N-acetyltransferase [unclassified Rhizobium]MBO9136738.1 GNAT family N-acetyltransferase [Rhizobium sp. B209b/85]QXZ99585.1 GNAT family N-acetyltransferase [Rhizobium sp. B230/85]